MSDLIKIFFQKSFEETINKDMLEYDFVFPTEKVYEYIFNILEIPYKEYIFYINEKIYLSTEVKDIPQYSSFADASNNICNYFRLDGDRGYKFDDVGKLLLNDGNVRLIGAYRKYGENHVKTATMLGLTQNIYNTFFLSCLGKVFNDLEINQQNALLARTALRNPFFAKIFSLLETKDVNIACLCESLSVSTIKRRKKNILNICDLIKAECKNEGYFSSYKYRFNI